MHGCKYSGDALANIDVPHTEFVHLFFVLGRGDFSKPDNTVFENIKIIILNEHIEQCGPSYCKSSDCFLKVLVLDAAIFFYVGREINNSVMN
jgi:hypothetical protein